jgi:uracil-DNA glycosylase
VPVSRQFDPGPVREPFASLCRNYPAEEAYPQRDFRLEWGPIFYRGRLDGSARVAVIGQDPGATEDVVRRILVGEAGHRVQGFLAKLGIERSYVMVNAFLYSVYGQESGERHIHDRKIRDYRHDWFDALLVDSEVEAVVAFGHLADEAFDRWKRTRAGRGSRLAYAHATHPTQPDAVARDDEELLARETREMLASWNEVLRELHDAIEHPDIERELVPYGDAFRPGDKAPIPDEDLPPGLPEWMRSPEPWASRTGEGDIKRATLTITIPEGARDWRRR